MRVGISGTHGTGKTTLAQALCAHLPGHVAADEPYYLARSGSHGVTSGPPAPGPFADDPTWLSAYLGGRSVEILAARQLTWRSIMHAVLPGWPGHGWRTARVPTGR